ncbi:minor capsid protein [Capybara microvirus Cap3_SP_363]|nr:minor capsid protein [Capybara microvirus Cap3_SP_363]
MSAIGGLLSSIGTMVGASINASAQNKTNEMNYKMFKEGNEFNEYMVDKQNQWNLDQWNRENEYNSPVNQVRLLREAGINPAGVAGFSDAGQLQSTTGQATHANPMQSNGAALQAAVQGAFDSLSNIEMFKAQIDNIKADTEQKKASAGLSTAQTATEDDMREGKVKLQNLDVKLADFDLTELKPLERDKLDAGITKLKYDADLVQRQADEVMSKIGLNNRQTIFYDFLEYVDRKKLSQKDQEIAISWFTAAANASYQNTMGSAAMMNASTNAKVGESQSFLNYSNINLNGAKFDNIKADTVNKGIQGGLLGIDFKIQQADLKYKTDPGMIKFNKAFDALDRGASVAGSFFNAVIKGKQAVGNHYGNYGYGSYLYNSYVNPY